MFHESIKMLPKSVLNIEKNGEKYLAIVQVQWHYLLTGLYLQSFTV